MTHFHNQAFTTTTRYKLYQSYDLNQMWSAKEPRAKRPWHVILGHSHGDATL